ASGLVNAASPEDVPGLALTGRSRSRGPSRSKGRSQSRARNQEGLTWADRAKQNTDKGPKKSLADRHLPAGPSGHEDYPSEYRGEPSEELDAPVTKAEVVKVLQELNGRSAPGPDGISNRLLRNLDEKSIEKLTEEINGAWETGRVPET
ncbi:hypothetical protein MTO96_034698, partial [Rhipicephalus appendiculatus]